MQKVPADFATREHSFVNQDGSVQMNVPLDQLLSRARDETPGFTWICVRASFIK